MTFSLNISTAAQRLQVIRSTRLEELAALRWQRCCEGVTVNGATFPGDEITRSTLAGALSALQQGMISAPVAWKTPAGFVELTQAKVEAAACAVVQHIQRCFAAEASVSAQIMATVDPAGFDVAAAFDTALEAQ